ncbi:hypothetical protein N2152v2_009918 [Parachlorella kessleri]
MLQHFFLEGLRDDVRKFVLTRRPTTFEQAAAEGEFYEDQFLNRRGKTLVFNLPKEGEAPRPASARPSATRGGAAANSPLAPRYNLVSQLDSTTARISKIAIVDLGASHSVLSQSVIRKLQLHGYVEKTASTFHTAGGREEMPWGMLRDVPVSVGRLTLVLDALPVTQATNYSILLGNDWLVQAACQMSWDTCIMKFMVSPGEYDEIDFDVVGRLRQPSTMDSALHQQSGRRCQPLHSDFEHPFAQRPTATAYMMEAVPRETAVATGDRPAPPRPAEIELTHIGTAATIAEVPEALEEQVPSGTPAPTPSHSQHDTSPADAPPAPPPSGAMPAAEPSSVVASAAVLDEQAPEETLSPPPPLSLNADVVAAMHEYLHTDKSGEDTLLSSPLSQRPASPVTPRSTATTEIGDAEPSTPNAPIPPLSAPPPLHAPNRIEDVDRAKRAASKTPPSTKHPLKRSHANEDLASQNAPTETLADIQAASSGSPSFELTPDDAKWVFTHSAPPSLQQLTPGVCALLPTPFEEPIIAASSSPPAEEDNERFLCLHDLDEALKEALPKVQTTTGEDELGPQIVAYYCDNRTFFYVPEWDEYYEDYEYSWPPHYDADGNPVPHDVTPPSQAPSWSDDDLPSLEEDYDSDGDLQEGWPYQGCPPLPPSYYDNLPSQPASPGGSQKDSVEPLTPAPDLSSLQPSPEAYLALHEELADNIPHEPPSTGLEQVTSLQYGENLTAAEKDFLMSLMYDNRDIFAWQRSELGLTPLVAHDIDTGDAKPIASRPYRHSFHEQQLEEQEAAFEELRDRLVSAPILARPDLPAVVAGQKQLVLQSDYSMYAVACICSQRDEDGLEHPIGYASRVLTSAERNYPPVEGEILAALFGICQFRHILHGLPFVLQCDQHSIRWLLTTRQIQGRLARWSLLFQEFDFTVEYRPGKRHINCDSLSRLEQTALEEEPPAPHTSEEDDWRHYMPASYTNLKPGDENYWQLNLFTIGIGSTHQPAPPAHLSKRTSGVLAGSNPKRVKQEGDPGAPGPSTTATNTLACEEHGDSDNEDENGAVDDTLHPVKVNGYLERVFCDLVGPLPASHPLGNKYIFTCIEASTRHAFAYPIPSKSSPHVAAALAHLFGVIGTPLIVQTDQGGEFVSSTMRSLLKRFNVQHRISSAYHPQSNGCVERLNKTITTQLRKLCSTKDPTLWETFLPSILLGYNNSRQDSLKTEPARLLFGKLPRLPVDPQRQAPALPATEGPVADFPQPADDQAPESSREAREARQQQQLSDALGNLAKAQERQVKDYAVKRAQQPRQAPPSPGQYVWSKAESSTNKLDPPSEGPF